MDIQAQRPVENSVQVLNGSAFHDVILRPRIEPLLRAHTLQDLLDAADPVARSLRLFVRDSPRFEIQKSQKQTQDSSKGPLNTVTVLDLSNTPPPHALALRTLTAPGDLASLEAEYTRFNFLGLADRLKLRTGARQEPHPAGWGSATFKVPAPLGVSHLALSGFFFNEDRHWASYSLASHGVAARLGGPIGDIGVEAVARHVHSIAEAASDVVRASAGANSLRVAAVARLRLNSTTKLEAEVAGKPGDAHHLKCEATTGFEQPLIGSWLLAEARTHAGYLHSSSTNLATNVLDRFTLGGPDLTGSLLGGVGPVDGTGADHVGAHAFWSGRFALHAAIAGPLRLTGLVDACASRVNTLGSSVFSNVQSLIGRRMPQFATVGGGITYGTGPAQLELLYTVPVRFEATDKTHRGLHLGVRLELA